MEGTGEVDWNQFVDICSDILVMVCKMGPLTTDVRADKLVRGVASEVGDEGAAAYRVPQEHRIEVSRSEHPIGLHLPHPSALRIGVGGGRREPCHGEDNTSRG